MKIIVTAGGTGGHIYPALSIINKFKEENKNLEVLYIGTHNRMEKDIIPSLGIKYEELEIYGFTKNIKRDIKNIFLVNKAYKKSLQIIKNFKPDYVLGFGGYVTFPVIKAAHKLGVKTFIHEQNSIPGKSNKLLAKYADIIGVTFEDSKKYFNKDKVIFTGHPRSDEAKKAKKITKDTLGFDKNKKLVVIVLGSLGSGSLDSVIRDYLNKVDNKEYQVLYITGKNHYRNYENLKLPSNIKIIPFFDDLIGLFKDTDVVISRAGSGVLNEIIALNIPAVIIPSPNVANNHQYYNALSLKEKKACVMLNESNINSSIIKENVERILDDDEYRKDIVNNLKQMEVVDSCNKIYNAVRGIDK
ncbi:MAG: undecaprenyldiphospho-muramoylpentapeptide beta-N-acetylglucosaminyltransferase [Firmicutes bacterium]|nr:undecaprenyldiphospho-muramoylpentapeptide beta-N-acetylglucosaminyltransferase [Bacillota bacterium]